MYRVLPVDVLTHYATLSGGCQMSCFGHVSMQHACSRLAAAGTFWPCWVSAVKSTAMMHRPHPHCAACCETSCHCQV